MSTNGICPSRPFVWPPHRVRGDTLRIGVRGDLHVIIECGAIKRVCIAGAIQTL